LWLSAGLGCSFLGEGEREKIAKIVIGLEVDVVAPGPPLCSSSHCHYVVNFQPPVGARLHAGSIFPLKIRFFFFLRHRVISEAEYKVMEDQRDRFLGSSSCPGGGGRTAQAPSGRARAHFGRSSSHCWACCRHCCAQVHRLQVVNQSTPRHHCHGSSHTRSRSRSPSPRHRGAKRHRQVK